VAKQSTFPHYSLQNEQIELSVKKTVIIFKHLTLGEVKKMKVHFYPTLLDFRKRLLLEGVCPRKSNL
jgi:hypothetical protein